MRICILCEVEKLSQVRDKMKDQNILTIPVSNSGNAPASHMFCCMAVTEERANKLLAEASLTTIEISGPKEFLTKWNLQIIK